MNVNEVAATRGKPNGIAPLDSTGSVPTAQLGNAVPAFTPTSPAYGAKFDGVTDDTAAWQAMFTAITAAGGGRVAVPAGTSIISSTLTLPNAPCSFEGEGYDVSIIQAASGYSGSIFVSANFGTYGVLDPACTFRNMTVNGNGSVSTAKTNIILASGTSQTINTSASTLNVGDAAGLPTSGHLWVGTSHVAYTGVSDLASSITVSGSQTLSLTSTGITLTGTLTGLPAAGMLTVVVGTTSGNFTAGSRLHIPYSSISGQVANFAAGTWGAVANAIGASATDTWTPAGGEAVHCYQLTGVTAPSGVTARQHQLVRPTAPSGVLLGLQTTRARVEHLHTQNAPAIGVIFQGDGTDSAYGNIYINSRSEGSGWWNEELGPWSTDGYAGNNTLASGLQGGMVIMGGDWALGPHHIVGGQNEAFAPSLVIAASNTRCEELIIDNAWGPPVTIASDNIWKSSALTDIDIGSIHTLGTNPGPYAGALITFKTYVASNGLQRAQLTKVTGPLTNAAVWADGPQTVLIGTQTMSSTTRLQVLNADTFDPFGGSVVVNPSGTSTTLSYTGVQQFTNSTSSSATITSGTAGTLPFSTAKGFDGSPGGTVVIHYNNVPMELAYTGKSGNSLSYSAAAATNFCTTYNGGSNLTIPSGTPVTQSFLVGTAVTSGSTGSQTDLTQVTQTALQAGKVTSLSAGTQTVTVPLTATGATILPAMSLKSTSTTLVPLNVASLDSTGAVPVAQLPVASTVLLIPGLGAPSNTNTGLNGDYYIDESSGYLYGPKSGGTWPTPTRALGQSLREAFLAPTGAIAETIPRSGGMTNTSATLASGQLTLTAIALPAGAKVSNITFISGTTAETTPQHRWFGLFDSNRNALALTADDTTTWAANTALTLPVATIASGSATSYTTTTTGLFYVGCMVASGGTMPTLAAAGSASGTGVFGTSPAIAVYSSTAQTTPPAFPFQGTASGTVPGFILYAYLT